MAKKIGEIVWTDLTVPDAENVREFYETVIGWKSSDFDMGGYKDYMVATPEDEDTVAGIVHARGPNADLPPYWINYIKVESLEKSREAVRGNGGEVLTDAKDFGEAKFCIVKDPAGAVFGIIEGDSGYD